MRRRYQLKCDPLIIDAYQSWHIIKNRYQKNFVAKKSLITTKNDDSKKRYFFDNFFLVEKMLLDSNFNDMKIVSRKNISDMEKIISAWQEVAELINYPISLKLYVELINNKMPKDLIVEFFGVEKMTADKIIKLKNISKDKYYNEIYYKKKQTELFDFYDLKTELQLMRKQKKL